MQSYNNVAPPQSLTMKVNLKVSCRKLKDLDVFSKSDPICRVYEKSQQGNQWVKIGQTERIDNNLNPDFKTTFNVNYFFEKNQNFKFEVIDDDGSGDYDLIGEIETSLGGIMGSRAQTLSGELKVPGKNEKRGTIIVVAESVQESNKEARFQFAFTALPSMEGGCLGMCSTPADVRFEITRKGFQAYTSEVARATRDPIFNPKKISLTQLANGDEDMPLHIAIVNRQRRELASIDLSVKQMLDIRTYNLKPAGTLDIRQFDLVEKPSFVDYLRSGWGISLAVAIDYTASNGDPSKPDSLHYLGPNNQYQAALMQVGPIIEPYDSDKMFPTFGFGGVPMGFPGVSHSFPLNGNPQNPEINTFANVVNTYTQTISSIQLSGPTYFAPIIESFIQFARQGVQSMGYSILLILTDGVIHDMAKTIQLVIQASELPCSIIIVGVGNADFSMMDALDGDDGLLRDDYGNRAKRDIVQFVRFNDCVRRGNLAEEVLKEVPEQVCSYMDLVNFQVQKIAVDMNQFARGPEAQ